MEEARQHSTVSAAGAAPKLRTAMTALALALCLAGCGGPSARERAQAEEENRHQAEIDARWDNVVNEARPVMATLNRFEQEWRNEGAFEPANQAGSK